MLRRLMLRIAHRGYAANAPENTLAAFLRALKAGAELIEFDVQAAQGGELFVLHDATLDRTTTGRGPIATTPPHILHGLDAGSWFGPAFIGEPLPAVTDALDVILPKTGALVERKSGTPESFAEMIESLPPGRLDGLTVQSFDWGFLAQLHAMCPKTRLAALGDGPLTPERLDAIAAIGATSIAWRHEDLDGPAILRAHGRLFRVFAWTVNDWARARALATLGVDGLVSDDPRVAALEIR
jgi:glycerophosphoryl diester phosphodiesterase